MLLSGLLLTTVLLAADEVRPASAEAVEALLLFHTEEAARWTMFVDEPRQEKAEFRSKPIYVWTNPTRSQGQHGAVFVWTHDGRPIAIGSTFSHPEMQRRMLCHEFHSLATGSLRTDHGDAKERWEPEAPIELLKLPLAPVPDASPARRLLQMKTMARRFAAHSVDYQKERWELRLLPQPLYRYEKPNETVLDGALFAFVTSAGTDPEVVLAIEARNQGAGPAWYYRTVRFSDSNLYVKLDGKEAWDSVRDDQHTLHYNPDHTYRLIRDRHVDELPEVLAE